MGEKRLLWKNILISLGKTNIFQENKWEIRKVVMIFVYAGLNWLSVFFRAIKLPQREDLWPFYSWSLSWK